MLAWVLFGFAVAATAGMSVTWFVVVPMMYRRHRRMDVNYLAALGGLLVFVAGISGGPAGVFLAIAVLDNVVTRIVVGVTGAGLFGLAMFLLIGAMRLFGDTTDPSKRHRP
jgi:protein-S-isoprenylcysteine O-methyltransferase Ste14